jgi:hypothetical protein
MAEATSANENSICGQCFEVIIGEPPNTDLAHRKPCPKCGSTTRNVAASMHAAASASAVSQAEVDTYPQRLLTIAQRLIDEGQFGIAVVVSHMACEIATERSLSESFAAKGVQILEDWVRNLHYGYNLANNRIRRLYTTLTGDNVQQQHTFWGKFKTSSKLRNKIIHGGALATKADAEASYEAAYDLVAHLKK